MQQQSNNKCKCGNGGNGTCKNCSKIRMAIMLKNGYKNKGLAKTWYSFYKKNNQPEQKIINGMIDRFKNRPEYTNAVNKLVFYDNYSKSNVIIQSLKVC